MNKDNAISYDLANHEQQQHLHPHHHQQQQQQQQQPPPPHPHQAAAWSHQRQLQQQSHAAYGAQQAGVPPPPPTQTNPQPHRGVIGQQQQQPSQQQQPHGQYHHPSQLQSSAAYYQSQAAHLYPTYQTHPHSQDHQSHASATPDHLQASSGVPPQPQGTNSSGVGLVPPNQNQHSAPHQPLPPNAIPNTQASVVNPGWSTQAPQPHHATATDPSASLAYMTHPYQSHNPAAAGDHHRGSNGPMSTQPIGGGPQAPSYSVDSLYNSPAAAVAAYNNYNNYNAAFFQSSNSAPHSQTGHPSSSFWNQNQQQTQQRSAHPQAISSSAPQRQHLGSDQAANFMHDPRVYYGRPAYNQGMQNFGQAPTQPQANVLHHRMNALSQQHPSLHHQDPMTQVPHSQQLPPVQCGGRSPGLTQPPIRPQAGSSASSVLPQSPSNSTSLPMSRPPPPPQPSLTPDRSPAATHSTSYHSPNHQSSSNKSTSNSLAQLEQMVMPGTGPSSTNTAIKSPTHRSTTSSPSIITQPQMQYSFNSTGQGSYFGSTGPSGPPGQAPYYSPYDSSNMDVQHKPVWSEQSSSMVANTTGPNMMDGSQNEYGQSSYEAPSYTTLSTPNQSRFPPPGEGEPHSSDKSDPYAIDSQTFDDYDDQTSAKGKKGRAKKSDDKVKKERKPRAPRAPKNAASGIPQPQSPALSAMQPQSIKQPSLLQGQELSPSGLHSSSNNFTSPMKPVPAPIGPPRDNQPLPSDPTVLTGPTTQSVVSSKSPAHRLSTESPSATQQQMQYSYSSTTQSPSLYQPAQTPERSPANAQPSSYPSPNQLSSPNKSTPNSIAPPDQVAMTNSNQSAVHPIAKSPTNRSTTNSPSLSAQPQMQYSFNSTGPSSYYSGAGPVPPPSQGSYYPPYDSSSIDMQPKPSWPNQNSASTPVINSSNLVGPTMIEGGQSSYNQTCYERPAPYGEYGAYPQPNQPPFVPPPQTNEPPSADKIEQPVIESQSQDDDQTSSKGKKSRAKKGDDKVKKERKPRAPKASKTAAGSSAQSSSPIPPSSHMATTQDPDLTTSPGSLMTSQSATLDDNVTDVTMDPAISSKSPSHRMSTDSPNATQHMQYGESSNIDISMSSDRQPGDDTIIEGGTEQSTSTPKPKKSRAKKGEEKVKKERKPRAAKASQPAPEPAGSPVSLPQDEITTEAPPSEPPTAESTPAEVKPKRIRVRDPSSKGKKKLPKFALKFAKTKKRKRLGSSDNDQSDLDKTPPPSPDEVESGVQKRRSARNTKKLKYNDDLALGFSESDDDSQVMPRTKKSTASTVDGEQADETVITDEPTVFAAPVEDTMVVEKIMSSRMGKRELEPEPGEVLPPDGTHIDVEEFYVKYKNLSYLHCDWRTAEELERGDRRIVQKIKRYKQKKDSSNIFSFMDEEPFDLQYCEVDRILAMNEVEEEVPDSDDEREQPPQEAPEEKSEENNSLNETPAVEDKPSVEKPEDTVDKNEVIDDSKTAANESDPQDVIMGVTTGEPKNEVDPKKDHNSIPSDATADSEFKKDESGEVKMDCNDNVPQSSDANSQDSSELVKPKKMKKKISRHFLVKWRGLSYEDSTWELEDHLDPDKIKHFLRFKDPPPKSKWKQVKRPKPEDWVRKEASPVYKNNNTLREYQLEGINWLSFCWHQGRNCILADEMGLGKTIQSIAFVNEIYQYNINGPFLIIVPLSTVGNWAREFETWTDLNVITYHGSSTSREMLKEYEMFYRNEQGNRITSYYKFQVMITTFEIILSDCLDLREIPWRCCIIDEAHRLKNRNCKLLEGLRLLNMEHRVLLTGTPLQNNVEELFSLLNFLEPTQFSSTEQFMQEFGDLKTEAQVDKLKLILKPMMLRRLKEDVEKTLAPKEETIVEVELTNIQKKYYRAILERNFSFLSKGSSNNNMPNLMNTMMELRKCCIHPYLINGAEEQIMYEARQTITAGGERMSSQQALINSSGKLVLIDKLLPRLRADGHRVLIFSQMVRCLDILEDYVTHKHYPFERIDGRVRGSDRQQAIDRFSKPGSDRFVFLLCTRAGGLGINLTAADTVIIFDSDWNPQNDLQAQARCHRIGQSKAVKIYRLICRNTYEREMFDKASLKLGLDKAVLQSMNTQKGGPGGLDGQLTKKEIEELLKKGAYGALMDDDNAGDKFCEEDIDHILQRRTQVITIDNSEAKGSTFSKATFSSSNNREDIELDDPNFWEKWAKKANIDADEHDKEDLIQLAPRRRTQTKRYGADGNLLDISDLESSEEDEETISMRTRGSRRGQPKLTPSSSSKRSKRRFLDFDDDDYMSNVDGGYWSKSDCLKIEKGLLTYGWGRWEKIISSNIFKRDISIDDCESICRVILLYCVKSYKGDEKIKSFSWELITPPEEANKSQSDLESVTSTRGRKPKSALPPNKKSIADEISEASWPKEAKNDPLIALPDDQYRRHLQRNCNRLLIRVKFLHYLKNDILKGFEEKINADCQSSEIDLPPVPVDGELPAPWWDDEADKSLLVGIYKHGHDKFNLIRQDPSLCFLSKCGPPNKDDLAAEMNFAEKVDDLDEECRNAALDRDSSRAIMGPNNEAIILRSSDTGVVLDDLVENVARDISDLDDSKDVVDENKNSVLRCTEANDSVDDNYENGATETSQTSKMDATDDDSMTNEVSIPKAHQAIVVTEDGEYMPFPSANDLNQRFRRLITAYQRNSKKLEIKLAQKARDELKKERTSKFEAARNEREERKRTLAQKWSRREEADFFRAISSFGVEYLPAQRRHDWNKFRSLGKLDKKLDDTLEEYYRAFIIMCKRVTSKPLTPDEEKCSLNVESITEERASKCLARIEFLSKIREQTLTHPNLSELLDLCVPQNDLPDWWELKQHDKDLLMAAAKHGLTRLDYNLANDPSLSFVELIRQKAEALISQPPSSIFIPLEQMQELLDRNGVEYSRDFDLIDDQEEITTCISDIISSIENDASDGQSFADLVNGPHSGPESSEKSLLALSMSCSSQKITRSSTNTHRSIPNIISRRSTSRSESGLRLTPVEKPGRSKVVEITPILPDKLPNELTKSFEAGEITVTILSESALVKLDDRDPIILAGATNPVNIKLRWPRDRAIQTRLENLVMLVERGEWPSPPKPQIPTITLPTPQISTSLPSTPLNITTTSMSKNDRSDLSLGSPTSDTSSMSRQDTRDALNDLTTSRNRRNRGRRPKYSESDPLSHELESPREDRNATAKLRNLLSQGSSNSRSGTTSSDRNKFVNSKQPAQSSPSLPSFKQRRNDGSGSSRSRDEQGAALDLNTAGAATNLLPQILASLKPEFRDLLANQDAATMLLNSFSSMTGGKNLAASLKGGLGGQFSLDSLLSAATNLNAANLNLNSNVNTNANPPRSTTKGPPPAHQRPDNLPPAHSGSARELRRNSSTTGDKSPPSFNLRSTRGRSSGISDSLSQHRAAEIAHSKTPSVKKRGRPSSTTSESPPGTGADVLDLSSLDNRGSQSSSRHDSRSRRGRDYNEDSSSQTGARSSSIKSNSKSGSKSGPTEESETTRTTRASKRIGSRIDALALNLQAKRMHRGDSPSPDEAPSSPIDPMKHMSGFSDLASNLSRVSGSSLNPTSTSSPSNAGSSDKNSRRSRQSSGVPPATASSVMGDNLSSRRSSTSLLANQATSNTTSSQIPTSTNPSSLPASLASTAASLGLANQFGNLNSLGGLLNIPGMNELMKQMSSSFPGLAGSLPKVSNSPLIPNPTTTTSTPMTSVGNSDKQSSRRSRQSTTTTATSGASDNSSSRRSSSSLLANQANPQTSQPQTSLPNTSLPSSLANSAASLNFANQFGNLNSLGGLLNFPNMNDLMKQMSNFPALAGSMPKMPGMPTVPNSGMSSHTSTSTNSSNDKANRRSRQATGASTHTTPSVSSQQAANAALNSFMNLASQPNAATSAYGNYSNPLANPFLPFNFGNLGMNNPLAGMGLFPGLYMPPGFPKPDQQTNPSNQSNNNSSDGPSKDKNKRYPRK